MELTGTFMGQVQVITGFIREILFPAQIFQRRHDKRHRRADVVRRVDEETYFVFVVFLLELVALISQDEIENEAYYK